MNKSEADPILFKDKQIEADFCFNTQDSTLAQKELFEEDSLDLDYFQRILAKDSHERLPHDLDKLCGLIFKVPLFRDLIIKEEPVSQADLLHLSKFVKYKKLARGEQVFKTGDKASNMYIIL